MLEVYLKAAGLPPCWVGGMGEGRVRGVERGWPELGTWPADEGGCWPVMGLADIVVRRGWLLEATPAGRGARVKEADCIVW